MAEKTEKATPKKLRDARNKGQVAKSQDLPSAFTFVVSIWVVLGMSSYLYDYLGGYLVNIFHLVSQSNLDTIISHLFLTSVPQIIFVASFPVLLLVTCVGVLVSFLAIGPVFSFEVFKPDIKKFNPVQNLKAKFKLKTLVEVLKSVIKVSLACWIIYDVMVKSLPVLTKTVSMPILGALMVFSAFLLEVVVKVGLLFIAIAVADYLYQNHNFAKEMKMEKFEVKQEYKNTEGDPHVKGRRRQLAQEIAYQDSPVVALKRAQALVTNPTHLAVAIAYRREIDPAPYILSMGKDYLADQMIKLAGQFDVPIVRNIPLAHQLWEQGEVYEFVPEETYAAIAEILRWLASLEEEKEAGPEEKDDEE